MLCMLTGRRAVATAGRVNEVGAAVWQELGYAAEVPGVPIRVSHDVAKIRERVVR